MIKLDFIDKILGLMVLCLVRFGGLDREPLGFSTALGTADYGAEAVGVIAAYGFFLIVFVQTVGILNGDQMQTSVSLWKCFCLKRQMVA